MVELDNGKFTEAVGAAYLAKLADDRKRRDETAATQQMDAMLGYPRAFEVWRMERDEARRQAATEAPAATAKIEPPTP